ncbi:hypothetical protein [Phytohabitans aurantiacus]|uniref:Uncharacterized protein n=1 Tax=Phytohabitans aurantiacus TaxID=3016789 RepID=A0ABQ5QLZ7_9ACTN|nr:hypothetical protein [Phytohabitans aurantiacus]GLH94927.1 hypothetical protein Pa4123_01990 [Phytohabitans aurantiacus]
MTNGTDHPPVTLPQGAPDGVVINVTGSLMLQIVAYGATVQPIERHLYTMSTRDGQPLGLMTTDQLWSDSDQILAERFRLLASRHAEGVPYEVTVVPASKRARRGDGGAR